MDIPLQGQMDGVAAAEVTRRAWDAPVVFLTAFSDAITVARQRNRALRLCPEARGGSRAEDCDLDRAAPAPGEPARPRHGALAGHHGHQHRRRRDAAAQKLTGWALEDGRSRQVDEVVTLVNEDDLSTLESPVTRVLAEGVVLGVSPRTSLVRRSGERAPIDDSAAPIRDDDGNVTGVVLVFRDVSMRRKVAEQMRQSRELEAAGRRAGDVAHDFNNQMTIVLGLSELALDDQRVPGEVRGLLEDIRQASERAASLTGSS